ncbi:hypothetical protein K432DRAFT_413101 [Lepidopterella palustris CBS 459.81]|uniref:BTB domain-containing protein n=1 Tax=Lepidopterella palustris CBS 459.81 TaxID=1314670 RepID=A0A8E2JKE3_9PEZI|nr:hypothetical protein K432DRAFT_413101 [Lepidopterella palustris CBS 459.81]
MWSTKKRTRGRSFSDRRQTPDIISLDPAGDLILVVGSAEANNGPRCFLVSTDALRRVSRVWRSMLNHSSGWFAKTSTKQVTSLNDDPDSLLIVLNVAHIRFKELPSALGFAQIVQLALVCDAYDTVQVVRPFLPEWTRPYEHAILRAGYEEWLFVAYTFGYMEAFKSIAHHLTLHAAIDEDGRCINQNGRVMDGHFPPDIINNILQVRYKTIWKFLRCCYALVDEMIEGNTCVASKTLPAQAIAEWDRAEEASKCTHLMHGSMVRQLKSLNLWPPLKNSSSIQFSVHDLANTLKGISVLTWAKPRASWDVEGDTGHEKCNVSRKLARNIDEVLEKMESAVSDRHLEHMDEQALK